MKKASAAGLGIAAFAAVAVATGPASAQVTFEPDPCVITLEPSYVQIPGQDITVPGSAITCPPAFSSFNPTVVGGTTLNVNFVGAPGTATTGTARLYTGQESTYDPAANGIVITRRIVLEGTAGTYGSVLTARGTDDMYVTDTTPNPDTNYRLVLARPFTITDGLSATPTCTLTMAPRYTYVWGQGQGNMYPVPDSAISCTGGVTFSSSTHGINANFDSRYQNQASLRVRTQSVYNPTTRTYRNVQGLWLIPASSSNTQAPAERREMGGFGSDPESTSGANATFGRFTSPPSGLSVTPDVPWGLPGYSTQYALTLAAPFTIKRRTDVTARATRGTNGTLAIAIRADRNASFNNKVAQTYRRQTVLPDTPADHAVVRRGNTVLKRVKLSPYGNGSVTVADPKGRNAYSVTMVATNDNYAGVARFTR
jgi:hypothetical protein